ncbi:fimbrillin family protein [Bacteroides intestinalis]|uniref:fimbrillin family protein n=1 Tax=Bacteroides intestinalis TaxID=329854 RepID=UPI000E1C9F2B|nr:fimbrillin family protein [Bacteroides intestinalis]QDO69584.1 DUF1566 domain-containing protein [Bacteroides intestinalis]UCB33766.1 fimbrillin family protein [Bacteroides intestinalis]UCB38007.1 fimbrillin family protein [Bacteroides intestinalis]
MKQHHSIFPPAASLACALILMLAACTSDALDELPPVGTDPDARPLTITVSDGGMYATGQTRAQERGYSTVFTEGDRIGLYVVKDGTLEVENLCLTLQGGKWTLPAGTSQLLYSPDRSYHAYYPYQDDRDLNGKVSPGDEDFFKIVVYYWLVKTNQSTYAQYTASDLMTARGVYSNHTLSFAMEHRMSLFILQVPATKYSYTEKIDGREISKSYYRYTAVLSKNVYWQENPCTARLLVNTKSPKVFNPGPYEYYYNGNRETFYFDYSSQLNLQPGKYTVHKVGDNEAGKEEFRSLAAGDYYMQDGSILPGNEDVRPFHDELQKSCLGVVFWVGEIEGIHWTQTGRLEGDRLLMRDHPECVHGMVVAMHDASQEVKWAIGKGAAESTYAWAKSFNDFTPGEQADWEEIRKSDLYFGYYRFRLMALYGSRHDDTTFPARNAIATYANSHPAPAGSSGWFLPGENELATLCFGSPETFDDSTSPYYFEHLKMLKEIINPQIDEASGNELTGEYWSSNESSTAVWRVNLDPPGYNTRPKTDTYKVRAVLAF